MLMLLLLMPHVLLLLLLLDVVEMLLLLKVQLLLLLRAFGCCAAAPAAFASPSNLLLVRLEVGLDGMSDVAQVHVFECLQDVGARNGLMVFVDGYIVSTVWRLGWRDCNASGMGTCFMTGEMGEIH